MNEYAHPELNKKVEFFGGSYFFTEEGKIPYQEKEVIYFLGIAEVESSCCGRGGCAFIKVPGYICSWKKGQNKSGQSLSEVERILDEEPQKAIKKLLEDKHPGVSQIEFL